MSLRFAALSSEEFHALQNGAANANGHIPEPHVSPGGAIPCRHCLEDVAKDENYLILSHRPFPQPQPYAEQGPIFLHADRCPRYADENALPPRNLPLSQILVKGYRSDDRIHYGTGQIIAGDKIEQVAEDLFGDPEVAYIHVRSATANCYHFRIERG